MSRKVFAPREDERDEDQLEGRVVMDIDRSGLLVEDTALEQNVKVSTPASDFAVTVALSPPRTSGDRPPRKRTFNEIVAGSMDTSMEMQRKRAANAAHEEEQSLCVEEDGTPAIDFAAVDSLLDDSAASSLDGSDEEHTMMLLSDSSDGESLLSIAFQEARTSGQIARRSSGSSVAVVDVEADESDGTNDNGSSDTLVNGDSACGGSSSLGFRVVEKESLRAISACSNASRTGDRSADAESGSGSSNGDTIFKHAPESLAEGPVKVPSTSRAGRELPRPIVIEDDESARDTVTGGGTTESAVAERSPTATPPMPNVPVGASPVKSDFVSPFQRRALFSSLSPSSSLGGLGSSLPSGTAPPPEVFAAGQATEGDQSTGGSTASLQPRSGIEKANVVLYAEAKELTKKARKSERQMQVRNFASFSRASLARHSCIHHNAAP